MKIYSFCTSKTVAYASLVKMYVDINTQMHNRVSSKTVES